MLLGNSLFQQINFRSLLNDKCFLCCNCFPLSNNEILQIASPSRRGDLDGEVGWGEEGEDLGGDVVATVVRARKIKS